MSQARLYACWKTTPAWKASRKRKHGRPKNSKPSFMILSGKGLQYCLSPASQPAHQSERTGAVPPFSHPDSGDEAVGAAMDETEADSAACRQSLYPLLATKRGLPSTPWASAPVLCACSRSVASMAAGSARPSLLMIRATRPATCGAAITQGLASEKGRGGAAVVPGRKGASQRTCTRAGQESRGKGAPVVDPRAPDVLTGRPDLDEAAVVGRRRPRVRCGVDVPYRHG